MSYMNSCFGCSRDDEFCLKPSWPPKKDRYLTMLYTLLRGSNGSGNSPVCRGKKRSEGPCHPHKHDYSNVFPSRPSQKPYAIGQQSGLYLVERPLPPCASCPSCVHPVTCTAFKTILSSEYIYCVIYCYNTINNINYIEFKNTARATD